jgi:hypothetical protein
MIIVHDVNIMPIEIGENAVVKRSIVTIADTATMMVGTKSLYAYHIVLGIAITETNSKIRKNVECLSRARASLRSIRDATRVGPFIKHRADFAHICRRIAITPNTAIITAYGRMMSFNTTPDAVVSTPDAVVTTPQNVCIMRAALMNRQFKKLNAVNGV